MDCLTIAYVVVLILYVMVGSALILWKCAFTFDAIECKLYTGGTVLIVSLWLLLFFICPLCVVKCSLWDKWGHLREKIKHSLNKIQGKRPYQICIQSEIYLPTTCSVTHSSDQLTCDDVKIIVADDTLAKEK